MVLSFACNLREVIYPPTVIYSFNEHLVVYKVEDSKLLQLCNPVASKSVKSSGKSIITSVLSFIVF